MSTATSEPESASAAPAPTPARGGLEGVVAATTRLSHVEGEAGRLTLAGYPLAEIAPRASCEEMAFLLWEDRLPSAAELVALRRELASHRALPPAVVALLRAAAAAGSAPMDALRMGVAALDAAVRVPASERTPRGDAVRLLAAVPSIVAAHHRLSAGREPVAPRDDLDHAASYLHLLCGEAPAPERSRALATYLNTVSDHGLNASTFTARVIVSTGSDLVSALAGAIGALKGPLHGGAPGPALDTVLEIGDAPEGDVESRAEAVLRGKLARGERLMGFGHRVYRVRDPRADVLAAAAERLFACGAGDRALYELALAVERVALRLLREHKPDRRLATNVEFHTALLLHGLGLPTALFTPTFAVGRTAGWTAHALEQAAAGRLIRPASDYSGGQDRRWVPVEERQGREAARR